MFTLYFQYLAPCLPRSTLGDSQDLGVAKVHAEHLPSMCKAAGSATSTSEENKVTGYQETRHSHIWIFLLHEARGKLNLFGCIF